MTVFRPRANGAELRFRQILEAGIDPGADSVGGDRSGAWIFQSNPKRHDLIGALAQGPEETWAVNQHRLTIQPGDRVWFRITGAEAGIYAAGTVTSLPREAASEFGDWRLDVNIHSKVVPPLLRPESDSDPVLHGVSALRGLMGTNLALTAEADARLEELTEDRLVPVSGATAEPAARALERKLNLDAARLTEQVERDLLDHLHALSPLAFEQLLRRSTCRSLDARTRPWSVPPQRGPSETEASTSQGPWNLPGLPPIRLAVQATSHGWRRP